MQNRKFSMKHCLQHFNSLQSAIALCLGSITYICMSSFTSNKSRVRESSNSSISYFTYLQLENMTNMRQNRVFYQCFYTGRADEISLKSGFTIVLLVVSRFNKISEKVNMVILFLSELFRPIFSSVFGAAQMPQYIRGSHFLKSPNF